MQADGTNNDAWPHRRSRNLKSASLQIVVQPTSWKPVATHEAISSIFAAAKPFEILNRLAAHLDQLECTDGDGMRYS
jgi:hypothetical protein